MSPFIGALYRIGQDGGLNKLRPLLECSHPPRTALSNDSFKRRLQCADASLILIKPRIRCNHPLNKGFSPFRVPSKPCRDLYVVSPIPRDGLRDFHLLQDRERVPPPQESSRQRHHNGGQAIVGNVTQRSTQRLPIDSRLSQLKLSWCGSPSSPLEGSRNAWGS